MRRQKSLRNGVHHADGVVWGPVYRTHLIFAMQLREFVMTPSNSPDAARTTTAHAKERTHPNAAVRSIVANALRSIVARNPALSPAMPHGYDEMAENAGFAAMTTPARSDASAATSSAGSTTRPAREVSKNRASMFDAESVGCFACGTLGWTTGPGGERERDL